MGELQWLEELVAAAVAVALLCFIVMVPLGIWRWMWKQRGIGFAQGWFEVQERHYGRGAVAPLTGHVVPGAEKGTVGVPQSEAEPQAPPPAPEKRATTGPRRYIVPRWGGPR